MHDLKVWANVEADGNENSKTLGKASGLEDEMSRIAKVDQIPFNLFILLSLFIDLILIIHAISILVAPTLNMQCKW